VLNNVDVVEEEDRRIVIVVDFSFFGLFIVLDFGFPLLFFIFSVVTSVRLLECDDVCVCGEFFDIASATCTKAVKRTIIISTYILIINTIPNFLLEFLELN